MSLIQNSWISRRRPTNAPDKCLIAICCDGRSVSISEGDNRNARNVNHISLFNVNGSCIIVENYWEAHFVAVRGQQDNPVWNPYACVEMTWNVKVNFLKPRVPSIPEHLTTKVSHRRMWGQIERFNERVTAKTRTFCIWTLSELWHLYAAIDVQTKLPAILNYKLHAFSLFLSQSPFGLISLYSLAAYQLTRQPPHITEIWDQDCYIK